MVVMTVETMAVKKDLWEVMLVDESALLMGVVRVGMLVDLTVVMRVVSMVVK